MLIKPNIVLWDTNDGQKMTLDQMDASQLVYALSNTSDKNEIWIRYMVMELVRRAFKDWESFVEFTDLQTLTDISVTVEKELSKRCG